MTYTNFNIRTNSPSENTKLSEYVSVLIISLNVVMLCALPYKMFKTPFCRSFQNNYGIMPTGKLNKRTIRMMKKPRCGKPDLNKTRRTRSTNGMCKKESTCKVRSFIILKIESAVIIHKCTISVN